MENMVQNLPTKNIARLALDRTFRDILKTSNVYFQPPPSIDLLYPAIIYRLEDISTTHANNRNYISHEKYSVTLVDSNPDSPFIHMIASLPKCRFSRAYQANGLNHWVFMIFE